MRILHYTLGFPPARSGGLVRYAIDVMNEESRQHNQVFALFPGNISILNSSMHIKHLRKKKEAVDCYELINSFPLPLFGGIKFPKDFMRSVNAKIFFDFLRLVNPDVVHIHTLMGLPREFLFAAKKMHIKIVFTSHDYFGLAPEPNFFRDNTSYDNNDIIENWICASQNAMSTWKLRLFQSKAYPIIRILLKRIHRTSIASATNNRYISDLETEDYASLKDYYSEMFRLIDEFHFNSTLTENVYKKNLPFYIHGQVISITDSVVKYPRNIRKKSYSKKTRIAYIGPDKSYKGFAFFLKLVQLMSKTDVKSKFEFHTFGYVPQKDLKGIHQHGKYNAMNLAEIYSNIDILVVPSQWKETFGLIVLESIYFKTPVLVSKNVGAKDLVSSDFIFSDMDDLIEKIGNNVTTNGDSGIKTIQMHVHELLTLYKKK